jgi:glycosyltransferase involved in cell wall biosynthesis
MSDITVVIPTRNEIKHIQRSVESALKITSNVVVVDSASTDGTIELAESLGVKIFQYEWTSSSSFSSKMNYILNELPITTTWIIRLDADEYFMNNCIRHLAEMLCKLSQEVNGVTLIRRIHFLGRWMKHSNEYPKTSMRITRKGYAHYEERWLDEHVELTNGVSMNFPLDIVDDNKSNITEWVNKHNHYSIKEAIELINQEIGLFNRNTLISNLDKNAQKKKREKYFYNRLPRYWRAFFFFCYRYFFKFGFLDGKEGFLWNFFQCWWYRTLADTKVNEIYKNCGNDKGKIIEYIKINYGIDCRDSRDI